MLRLLGSRDMEFVRSQPGFTPAMEHKLRADRCAIFRGYLRSLDLDFSRVCSALKLVMVQSQIDRPDLASAILTAQFTFACKMIDLRFHLALNGWNLGSVDVTGLVGIFDGMLLELRTFVPAVG